MPSPVIIKPIPEQVVSEKASFGPLDLNEFIQADDSPVRFVAGLAHDKGLPAGLICTPEGMITGIAHAGTLGTYQVIVTASNEEGSIDASFALTIKENLTKSALNAREIADLKSKAWQALENNLPLPDISAIYERDITPLEVYYLLERWGTLTIYDAYNLDPPGEKKLLTLKGVSEHFEVYDRGCCLVASPKELFSYERTVNDGLMTAKAMAREVYQRGWACELIGFEKYSRAAWIELQLLIDKFGKEIEIINYAPSTHDIQVYTKEAISQHEREQLGLE